MPEFVNRGLRLTYMDQGEGLPFIFLHGLGGSIMQILGTFEAIHGVRLITLDQQGHGSSDVNWDTFSFSSLAEDVVALARHLRLPSFVLGGISMGAAVSIHLALRFPCQILQLVLVRPAWIHLPMSMDIQRLYNVCAAHLQYADLKGFMETPEYIRIKELSAYTSSAFTAYFSDEPSVRHSRKFILLPPSAPFDDAGSLRQIDVPTAIIACKSDYIHPFEYGEYYFRHIPGARIDEIPDKDSDPAGHKVQLNAHLCDFLLQAGGK